MKNIVLTGFMASGKTTVGKLLAKKLGRVFCDTDEMIVTHEGCEINEIFAKNGEEYFRDVEEKIVKKASEADGCVIATGGGVVLRKENIDALRQNGIIINLNPTDEVIKLRLSEAAKTRPLLSDIESALSRKRDREPFYADCDVRITITPESTPLSVATEIMKYL